MMRQTIIISFLAIGFFISIAVSSVAEEDVQLQSKDLLNKGDDYFNSEDIDQALQTYIQASEMAATEGDSSVLTEAYSQIARCYLRNEKKDEGRPWLEKAKEIAAADDPPGWSRYLGVRGRFEWKDAAELQGMLTPETDKASNTFKEMYAYCLDHGLYERAIDAANMVSITGRKDERVDWAKKGIDAAEKGNLQNWLAPLWNNLGWAYDDLGMYQESLEALEKARVYHYRKGEELSMLIADWSVGHALRMTGQLDSALTVLERVQRLAMLRKGEEKSIENSEWLGFACLELGDVLLARGGDRNRILSLFKVAYNNLSQAGMGDWDPKRLEEIKQKMTELSAEMDTNR